MKISVKTFNVGTSEEKARKVCEEAFEFYAAHYSVEQRGKEELMMEIGDLFTILMNYCAANKIDAQYCVDLAEVKNLFRGMYDNAD